MGLALEFLTGDSLKIEDAFLNGGTQPNITDFDLLDDPRVVHKRADFSLHIIPKDLDLLSYQFGKISGNTPIALRPYLHIIQDEEHGGLLSVDLGWVAYVAAVGDDTIEKINEGWFDAMRREYPNENLVLTQEAREAVGDLVSLCKYAVEHGLAVYHWWWP